MSFVSLFPCETNYFFNKNQFPIFQEPSKKKAKKRIYGAPTKPNYKPEKEFVDWTPPQGQTGDGRTALNDKLGY